MATDANWLTVEIDDEPSIPPVNTVPSCMTLSDVECDNYVRLLVADISFSDDEPNAKLRIFRGTRLKNEHKLSGVPAAIVSFYIDESEPKTPVIAVAIAESVLFFRHLKPYFKYTLPTLEVEESEHDIWRKLPVAIDEERGVIIDGLKSLNHSKLTRKSQKLMQLPFEEQEDFIKKHTETPVERHANIVALCCLQRVSSDVSPPSYLVIATDNGDIFILEPQSFGLIYKAKSSTYETVPSLLTVHGTYESDFCIVVASRYGSVYLLRKAAMVGQEIFKMSYPMSGVVLLPIDQTIVVATMDNRLVCCSKKGKQLYQLPMSALPICMIPITLQYLGITLICVAIEGGLVQFYMQRYLVDEFQEKTTVCAMHFGRMGMEDHVLTLVTIEGELIVKILRRFARFEPNQMISAPTSTTTRANEFEVQKILKVSILQKPKKSSIFVEQLAREKQNAKATYGSFQVELWRLRHTATRATVDAINSSESTISGDITFAPVKVSAEVCGTGPVFRVYLTIQNLSTYKMASNLAVLLHANRMHYTIQQSMTKLPSVLPGIPLKIDFEVTAVLASNDQLPPLHTFTADSSYIRVMLLKAQHAKPFIAAVIAMPQAEVNL